MAIASMLETTQHGDRLFTWVTTNVPARRLILRLETLKLLVRVETIHAVFADRAEGGNGYEILWKRGVQWAHLEKLVRL